MSEIAARVAKMSEAEVRAALIDLAEAATSDPEALVVDTEGIVDALDLHGLNVYEGYEDADD